MIEKLVEEGDDPYGDHCCGDCKFWQAWPSNPHKGNCPYQISWFWITMCTCNKFRLPEESPQ